MCKLEIQDPNFVPSAMWPISQAFLFTFSFPWMTSLICRCRVSSKRWMFVLLQPHYTLSEFCQSINFLWTICVRYRVIKSNYNKQYLSDEPKKCKTPQDSQAALTSLNTTSYTKTLPQTSPNSIIHHCLSSNIQGDYLVRRNIRS